MQYGNILKKYDEVLGENLRPGRLVDDSVAILAGYGS